MSYDVFISYNGADLGHVNMLDAELRKLGKKVWLDKREIAVGTPIEERIRLGVRASQFLCPILTPKYERSWWTGMEAEAMKMREGLLAPTRILPCLFEGAPPTWCAAKAYADFRSSFSSGLAALLSSMEAASSTQKKRTTVMKAVAAAGVTVLGWAALTPDKKAQRCRSLLQRANAATLAQMVRARGLPVGTKHENIERLTGSTQELEHLLDDAFTVDELRELARVSGLAVSGRKRLVIKSLLEAA